jgi:hypothetical protein
MTRLYKLTLISIAVTALAGGCKPMEGADEFRNAVPREQTVEMSVPGNAGGQALTVEAHSQALDQGKIADTLQLTRLVSGVVNGGGALVLGIVKGVTLFPPTELAADHAVWGPWSNPKDDDPVTWKLTVTKVAAGEYTYKLEGRDETLVTGPFTTVLSGTHRPTLDAAGDPIEGFGRGDFLLDWDARNTLPPAPRHPLAKDPDVGTAQYTYARVSAAADVEVDAAFRNVRDDERPGQRVNLDYRYRSTPANGGSMEFVHAAPKNMNMNAASWAVKSRWKQNGAGRSDVRAKGGDLPAGMTATFNECWDSNYASRFAAVSWWAPANYGTEATDCAFTPAEYSTLPF